MDIDSTPGSFSPFAKASYAGRANLGLASGGSNGIYQLSVNEWQQQHMQNAALHWHCYSHYPWVRSCIDLIAQYATTDQYTIEGPEDQAEALEAYLEEISPENRSFDRLLRSVYRDLQIDGNCYLRMTYARGKPAYLFRVDFQQIVPNFPRTGGTVESYAIYSNLNMLEPEIVPASKIIHLTLNDSGPNHTGLSPLESLDMTLALDLYATQYQHGFFKNGVKAGDVYAADGSMDPETYERDKRYLMANFTKPEDAYTPLFMQGKWTRITCGQELRKDADFLKLREWNREEVASVLSVPLSLLSTSIMGSLGANGKEQDRLLFMNAVVAPLQKQVMEDFNYQLLQGQFKNRSVKLVPPGRSALRLEDVQQAHLMSQIGATANEIRALVNLPEVDGGDIPIFMQPGSTIIGLPGHQESVLLTARGALPGVYVPLPETDSANLRDPLSDAESQWDDPAGTQPQRQTHTDQKTMPDGEDVMDKQLAATRTKAAPVPAAKPKPGSPAANPHLGQPLKGSLVGTNKTGGALKPAGKIAVAKPAGRKKKPAPGA